MKLKEDFIEIKKRIDTVETNLSNQLESLKEKELKWKKMDGIADEIKLSSGTRRVTFNISGKLFTTTVNTLLNTKDTLFYKMLVENEVDIEQEIFFDRDPKLFSIILEYLRTKSFDKKKFGSSFLRSELRNEAEYFEVNDILTEIGVGPKELEFIDFKYSGPYITSGITVGTNKVEDLNDISMKKGICCASPYWITIELNDEWDINGLDIGGYAGNTSYWSSDNGNGASIKVSTDNLTFQTVGTIPSGYGSAVKHVSFTSTRCRFIKFEYSSYLGLGYLKLNTT